jgi:hypothetical protein
MEHVVVNETSLNLSVRSAFGDRRLECEIRGNLNDLHTQSPCLYRHVPVVRLCEMVGRFVWSCITFNEKF